MNDLINDREKRVLGALNKLGESPISTIAHEILINRTALYHTMEKLLAKGLVSRVSRDKVAYYRSITIEEYDDWSRRQIANITKEAQDIHTWLITQHNPEHSIHVDARYFEGAEGVKNLYADTWRDNEEKVICAITDYTQAYAALGTFFENEYFPARIAHGVKVRSLLPESASGKRDTKKAHALLRDMRFINLFKDLGIEINIYGPKIALVVFDKKKPSGVLIKNDVLAHAFRKIFDYLWDSADK